MCLACEQDALWFAYLQRRGLVSPDGRLTEAPPFPVDPIEPQETQRQGAQEPKDATAREAAGETTGNKFSCDDPTAG